MRSFMNPLALALPAVLLAPPLLAADIVLPAKAPVQRTVQLETVWRIGGDDEDILLGLVGRGVRDAEGRIYLLDNQLSQVLIIGPDGDLINTLGRPGQGPGELNYPVDLYISQPGQVGVTLGFPGKIVLLNDDGSSGGIIPLGQDPSGGGFAFAGEVRKMGDNLIVSHGGGTFNLEKGKLETLTTLVRLDEEGRELVRYGEHIQERDVSQQVFDEAADFSEFQTWAVGPDGVFTFPSREDYTIDVKNLDGTLRATISRPFETRRRTKEDKAGMTAGMTIVIGDGQQEAQNKLLDTDPAILSMQVAPDGRLFVENCYHANAMKNGEVARRYDVIDPEGTFLEELSIQRPGFNKDQDALQFLDGEYFLWMRNIKAAQDGMMSSFRPTDADDGNPAEDLDEVEPLEVVLCKISQ